MTFTPPRKLSTHPASPSFDREVVKKIDKVLVDGVHVPECVAYNMDEGWAFGKKDGIWQPRVHGVVTVTVKQGVVE